MGNRLSDYGHSFQYKLIASLFTDKQFLQQISDILDYKYFESDSNKFIVEVILEYYKQYKDSPTLDVIKIKLQNEKSDTFKMTVIENIKEVYKYFEANDLAFIKEQTMDFCKNQCIKKAIEDSLPDLECGDYDSIKTRIDNALKAGVSKNIGHEYNIDIDKRYEKSARQTISTGWEIIDELMDGGLAPGELGVIVSISGGGKSWLLSNIGYNAAKIGLNVIHYTLELNENYVGLRYDSIITGIPAQNLKYNINEVKDNLKTLKGNIIIQYYPTKGASVINLNAHIERCKIKGYKPDLIIVDYADLLRDSKKNQEVRLALSNIYEDLRCLAGEYNVPCWTASQSNRSSSNDNIIQADRISESFNKIMTADFVMSLSRKIEDKANGTGRLHVVKNRFGPDGVTLPSKANLSNGRFDIFAESSIGGKEAKELMKGGDENLRKILSQKFKEMQ